MTKRVKFTLERRGIVSSRQGVVIAGRTAIVDMDFVERFREIYADRIEAGELVEERTEALAPATAGRELLSLNKAAEIAKLHGFDKDSLRELLQNGVIPGYDAASSRYEIDPVLLEEHLAQITSQEI